MARKSAVRNNLESSYYRIQGLVEKEEFVRYAQATDITAIQQNLLAALQCLDADEEKVGPEYYDNALTDLLDSESVISRRQKAYTLWRTAASRLKYSIESVKSYVSTLRKDVQNASGRPQTENDLENLLKMAEDASSWLASTETSQGALGTNVEPIVPDIELLDRAAALDKELLSISSKKIVPTTSVTNETPSASENASDVNAGEPSETVSSPPEIPEKEDL